MQYFPWEYCAPIAIKPQENSKMFERYPMVAGISISTHCRKTPGNIHKPRKTSRNFCDSFIFQLVKRYEGFSLSRVNGL